MDSRYLAGAIAGSLVAGSGITAMMIAGERKSGKPSELIDLQRNSARKLRLQAPDATRLPTDTEQVVAQGGHLLLSGIAGTAYAAATSKATNPLVGGVVFGLAFYALAHWLVGPLLGVKAPEWTEDRRTIALHAANHVGFGLVTAFAAATSARL